MELQNVSSVSPTVSQSYYHKPPFYLRNGEMDYCLHSPFKIKLWAKSSAEVVCKLFQELNGFKGLELHAQVANVPGICRAKNILRQSTYRA